MAYITCKQCGCQMSDKSEACPVCGTPVVEKVINEEAIIASNDKQVLKTCEKINKHKQRFLLISIALITIIFIAITPIIIHKNKEKQAAEQLRAQHKMAAVRAELKEQKRKVEIMQAENKQKEIEYLISEIKRQILDAFKKGTIYDIMTSDFKSAKQAAMEAQDRNGIYFDADIFYHTQDESPDEIDVSEVNLMDEDKAFVKVVFVFRNDWGKRDDSTVLLAIRDKQASNSNNAKWLIDDIVELKGGVISYSEKASMREFAAE